MLCALQDGERGREKESHVGKGKSRDTGRDQYEVARQRASGESGPGRQGAAIATTLSLSHCSPSVPRSPALARALFLGYIYTQRQPLSLSHSLSVCTSGHAYVRRRRIRVVSLSLSFSLRESSRSRYSEFR